MLIPSGFEKRLLRIHHPWLARLRGAAHRFKDEEESFLSLLEQVQAQLLMRMRLLDELNEMKGDVDQTLKYARFVQSITEGEGIWVDDAPSYLDLLNHPVSTLSAVSYTHLTLPTKRIV